MASSVLVSGLGDDIDNNTIRDFFGDQQLSGGGPIHDIEDGEDEDQVLIVFKDSDVAERVARKKGLQLKGYKLTVEDKTRRSESYHSLLVGNLSDNTDRSSIVKFFKDEIQTGPIKDIDDGFEEDDVIITFEDAKATQRVQEYGKLILDGNNLRTELVEKVGNTFTIINRNTGTTHKDIQQPKREASTETDTPDTIVVTGIGCNFDEDRLLDFFESKRRSGGGTIKEKKLGPLPNQMCVTYEDKSDAKIVAAKGHLDFDGQTLSVKIFNTLDFADNKCLEDVTASVIVGGLQTNFDEDHFLDFFESKRRSGGGDIKEKKPGPSPDQIIITYENRDDAQRVAKKKHLDFDGQTLSVRMVTSFDLMDIKESACCIEVSGVGSNSTRDDLWDYFEGRRRSGGGQIADIKELGQQGNQKCFRITFKDQNVADRVLQKSDHVLDGNNLYVKHATMKSTNQSAGKVLDSAAAAEDQTKIPSSLAANLLKIDEFPERMMQKFPGLKVFLNKFENVATFFGTDSQIKDAKLALFELVHNKMVQKKIDLPDATLLLFQRETLQKALYQQLFKVNNIVLSWMVEHKHLILCAYSDNDIIDAHRIIKENIVSKDFEVSLESQPLLQDAKWQRLEDSLVEKYGGLLNIQSYQSGTVVVTTLIKSINHILGEIESFLSHNTLIEKFLPFKKGIVRCIRDHRSSGIEGSEAKIVPKIGKTNGFLIKGTEDKLQNAERLVKDIVASIRVGEHEVATPGMAQHFSESREHLETLEEMYKCTIEIDAVASEANDDITDNHSINSGPQEIASVICSNGRSITVMGGDITKHHCDAIIVGVNKKLEHREGLAREILEKGGSVIQEMCERLIKKDGDHIVGDVAITEAGTLHCKKIAHAVIPTYTENSSTQNVDEESRYAIYNSLDRVNKPGFRSVAIPDICCDAHGKYPLQSGTEVIVRAVKEFFDEKPDSYIKEVHLIDNKDEKTSAFHKSLLNVYGRLAVKAIKRLSSQTMPYAVASLPTPSVWSDEQTSSAGTSGTFYTNEGMAINLKIGLLADQKMDVLVNSTDTSLNLQNGAVSSSILKGAGPGIQNECKNISPSKVKPGQVIVTQGYNLKCSYVCHGACEQWDGQGNHAEQVLRQYVNACLTEVSKKKKVPTATLR